MHTLERVDTYNGDLREGANHLLQQVTLEVGKVPQGRSDEPLLILWESVAWHSLQHAATNTACESQSHSLTEPQYSPVPDTADFDKTYKKVVASHSQKGNGTSPPCSKTSSALVNKSG